jgi:hypothetical protein
MAVIAGAWAAISGAFTATALGTFLTTTTFGKLLTSVALSALKAALMRQPDQPPRGLRTAQTMTGGITAASFILGSYATEGQLTAPPMTHGNAGKTPNAYLTYVIDTGDIPKQTLEGLILDGEAVEIGDTPHADYGLPILGRFTNYAWVRFHDGTQTTADPMLLAKYPAPLVRPWSSDMVGHGIPYAVFTFKFNREVFSSFPKVRLEIGGIPLYDPRKDSTVGGTGAHRWADRATWERSENTAVQVYNILRGIDFGSGEIWGAKADAEDLPLSVWWAAMNVCDVLIDLADGGTEPQYRTSFEVRADDEPAKIIEELLRATGGEVSENGGVWKIRMGPPPLPVYFFSDDDILISQSEQFEPFSASTDPFNGVQVVYPDPEALWEPRDAPALYNAAYEEQDGGQRNVADLTFSAAPYPLQVQRVQLSYLEDERRFARHVLALPSDAVALEALDAVAWTSERNGYVQKVFEITSHIDPLLTGAPRIALRERDPNDYDWSTDFEITTPPVFREPITVPAQAVTDFAAQAWSIPRTDSTPARPAILLTWDGDQPDVRGLRWELQLEDATPVTSGSTQDVERGALVVSEGVLPGTAYRIHAKFVVDRPTVWTEWLPVTTFDIRLTIEDLNEEVRTAFERHDVALEDADGTLGELRDAVTAALGPLDALISLTDRVVEAYGPLDQEIPLDERIQTLTGNYELALPERIDASRQLDLLNERLLSETLERAETERVLSQAGIVVDEATGRVTIEGLVQAQQRITEVRVVADALLGQINLTVTRAQLLEEISRAVLSPEQVPIFDGLQGQITTLQTLLDVATATIALKADVATVDAYGVSLSEAQVKLNALQAELLLRVSTSDFTAVADRLTSVETAFSALEGAELVTLVSDVHRLFDDIETIHETTLEGLLDALEGREAARVDLALVREDLTARVFEGEQSVAALRQTLITAFADATALVRRESETRAAALLAQAAITDSLRTDLDGTDGQVSGTAQAVDALAGRVAETEDGLEASVQSSEALTARIASETGDRTNAIDAAFEELIETDLRALLDDHDTRQLLLAGIAQAKQDVFAIVLEGREALAGARAEFTAAIGNTDARVSQTVAALATEERARIEQATILLGRLAAAEGALSQLNTVDVTSSSALVQAFLALTGRVGDTEGAIEQINTVDVESESALVQALLTLTGRVGDTEGAIERINTVDVDSESALVQAHIGLSAEVTNPDTGLSATRGSVENLQEVVGGVDSGLVRDVTLLNGQIFTGGPGTIVGNLGEVRQIVLDEETGLVSKVTQLSAGLENVEGGIVGGDAFDALFAEVTQNGDELTALTARQNVISANLSSGNLLPDPNLINAGTWTLAARWSRVPITVLINNPDGSTTTQVIGGELQYSGGVSQVLAQSPIFPVTANAIYTMGFEARSTSAGSTAFLFRLEFLNAGGTVLAALPNASSSMADGTHRYEGSFKAPATAASARMRITASGTGSARLTAIATRQDLVRGEIETLAATRVTAAGAVSAVEQVISATYGSLEGLAEATAFAEASIDGIIAGYVWRLNGQNLLELVSVSDGVDGPTSTFRLAPDYVQITGIAQINTAVIELLAVSDALVDNLRVGRAQIEDTIQSDDYAENAQGVPTAGVKLDFRAGYPSIKVAGPVISRQIKVAEGARAIPQAAFGAQNSGFGLDADDWAARRKTYWVDQTPIPMTAWLQPNKTYLATAALRATVAGSGAPDIYWGVDATILPMTRWDGNQSLRLKLDVWTRNVTGWSAGFIDWTIYEVT